MSNKLYVGNISFNTSHQDLIDLFSPSGTVTSANIIEDRETGRSRGFGFVEMSSREEAQNAITALNGKAVDGRDLKVNEAKPREDRGSGGGRGRNGGGSGYGSDHGGGYGGGKGRW
jgi:RNA recognition motif-containing protein